MEFFTCRFDGDFVEFFISLLFFIILSFHFLFFLFFFCFLSFLFFPFFCFSFLSLFHISFYLFRIIYRIRVTTILTIVYFIP